MRVSIRCTMLLSLFLAGFSSYMLASGPPNDAPAEFRDGVVLLAFKNGVTPAQQSAVLASIGATEIKVIGVGVHVVSVGPGRVLGAIQSLKARGEIRYAEPDLIHRIDGGPLPNDPSVGIQWAIQNTGQNVNNDFGTAGADERTLAAWGVTTGSNSVVFAVTDTGTQYSHPDLITNMWNNPGGIGGCAAGTHGYNVLTATCDPMDDDDSYGGHGTHVSGILGATGNNAAGVAGVNWTTSIMAVKWVTGGSNPSGLSSDLITALDWVIKAKQAGVNVRGVNDSATWPGTAFSQAVSDEIDLLGANDILFTTAAGNTTQNNDTTPRYPCSYNRPNMICVAATTQDDLLWSSSNWGATTVQLGAPGMNIYSTLRVSNYGFVSGTSMAAPQVLGTAGLILSLGYQPVSTLKSMILNAVDPLASLSGLVATGGRLNVCKAVPGCSTAVTGTPSNVAVPVVTGITRFGSLLGASTGLWTGVPTTYSYHWFRCDGTGANCTAISGASSQTYAPLATADAGATLRVSVTASNTSGSNTAQSGASAIIAQAASPFVISSTLANGGNISGIVPWQATSTQTLNFVEFFVDGVLAQTVAASPYVYNLDTTKLPNGVHVFGIQALSTDNRTYGFQSSALTVANGGPTITTTTLPGGTQNAAYSTSVSATGGTTPYTWSVISGSLPAGLTLAPGTGVISGTPTASGTSNFTVQVADATSAKATQALSITINPSGGGGGIALAQSNAVEGSGVASVSVAFPSPNLAGNTIIAAVRMSSATQTVQVSDTLGNIYTDAVSQTQTTDGHQIHIFYAKNVAGGANTVKATFSASNNHPWLAIYEYAGLSTTSPLDQTAHAQGSSATPNTGPTATTASANELVFAAAGFVNSYAGTATAGGGFTLQQQDTGTSRAATETSIVASTGSYAGAFTLSSSTNWSAVVATFAASGASGSSPSISTSVLPGGTQNAAYTTTLAVTGGAAPYTWSITVGSLPAGLSLAPATGVISGTPTGTGTSSFTAQVMDNNSATATKALSITVNAPPAITTSSLPGGNLNVAYTTTVAATGGTAPYTWSVSAGALPAGLTLAASSGVISGTPTATGTSNFTVQVSDANSVKATKSLSITVTAVLTVTTGSLSGATQNAIYSKTLAATGGTTPYTWSISVGSLPPGLTLAPSTGVISGTPTATGTSSFTAQVTDANSLTAIKSLSITVNAPPAVATNSLPGGTQNAAYSTTLSATAGTTPYTWSVISGALPSGLTLTPGTGVISGTPTTVGSSSFTVQVTDANSATASSQSLTLTINPPPPSVTTTSLPNGVLNKAYTATLAATGGTPPYTWSIRSGALPAGLSLNPNTGVISGTPTTAGNSSFTVQVTDAASVTATKGLSINVKKH